MSVRVLCTSVIFLVGKIAIGPTEFLCKTYFAGMSPKQVGLCKAHLHIVSEIHSTNYVAVFITDVQDILHMYSFGGTIGRENWCLGLPSHSAKLTFLKCHQSEGIWAPAD